METYILIFCVLCISAYILYPVFGGKSYEFEPQANIKDKRIKITLEELKREYDSGRLSGKDYEELKSEYIEGLDEEYKESEDSTSTDSDIEDTLEEEIKKRRKEDK